MSGCYPVPMVEHPILRSVFAFRLTEETAWYMDKALVGELVEVVGTSRLGPALSHAGVYGKAQRVTKTRGLAGLVAKGKSGPFQALDAADEPSANITVSFDLEDTGLGVTVMVGAEAYRAHARTLLDDIEGIGLGLHACMNRIGGRLSLGFAHPMARGVYSYPQVRPPVSHHWLETSAILEFFDRAFHQTDHEEASKDEVEAMATATVPAGVRREVRDGVTIMRWIDHLEDDDDVARAAGRHERWMAGLTRVKRSAAYNALGDKGISPRKDDRSPFTFFDASKRTAYKAIAVDASGAPDEEVWSEMAAIVACPPPEVTAVWLVAPLRDHAKELSPRARSAGFAGVLYPEGGKLWDPRPPGLWIDEDTEP